jgi:hypothetical protein
MNQDYEKVLRLITDKCICILEGKRMEFSSGQEAIDKLDGKYVITYIRAEDDSVVIMLESEKNSENEEDDGWIQKHIDMYGKEPNLFDGV